MTNSENCRVVALNRTELGVNEHQVWIEDVEMGAKVRREAQTGMRPKPGPDTPMAGVVTTVGRSRILASVGQLNVLQLTLL